MKRLALAVIFLVASPLAHSEPEEQPRDLGLSEAVTTRLAQIDVSISGPEANVAALRDQDFELWIEGKKIEKFNVDRTCSNATTREEAAPGAVATAVPAAAPAPRPTTYLLYFDHAHLTLGGRQRSIDIAKELIPKLMINGARATLVSNAQTLETVVPLTDSSTVLLQGLDKMENDKTKKYWDPYSALEENRVEEVAAAVKDKNNVEHAVKTARDYQREERWRQGRDLTRLAMILGRFAEMDPPKAALYFADTMRRNAGEHYLSFFPDSLRDRNGSLKAADNDSLTAALSLDRVINEASSFGIRFYPIEGQGLTAPSLMVGMRNGTRVREVSATDRARRPDPEQPGSRGSLQDGTGSRGSSQDRTLNNSRLRDAQDTLGGLALETGGRAFLNGVPAPKIAQRILSDLSCMFLVSFDPRGLREDSPLRVQVQVKDSKVNVQTRGRLVVQSEASRLTSRLMATFAAPDVKAGDVPLRVGIIPGGFEKGRYKVRVQVAVPGTPVIGATWDLGVSLVSRGEVRADASTRIRTTAPNTPAVFETDMEFGPGPYELVAVAHDATGDQTANRRVEGSFPDPDAALAMIGPIALVQRVNGAFVRDKTAKTSGNLVTGESEPLRADLPSAALALVCRAKDQKGKLEVERTLVGQSTVEFPKQQLELGDDRCVQILDVIPEGALGAGTLRYVVRVIGPIGPIARGERTFVAVPAPSSEVPQAGSSPAPTDAPTAPTPRSATQFHGAGTEI